MRKAVRRSVCNHVGGETFYSNGLPLKCCTGVGATCKLHELDFLTDTLERKCCEIDNLKARLVGLEKDLAAARPIHITINNYGILVTQGVEIVRAWSHGTNLYDSAYTCLLGLPTSPERDRLLRLSTSFDAKDRLTFERSVIEGVEEVLDSLPAEVRAKASALLSKLRAAISQPK